MAKSFAEKSNVNDGVLLKAETNQNGTEAERQKQTKHWLTRNWATKKKDDYYFHAYYGHDIKSLDPESGTIGKWDNVTSKNTSVRIKIIIPI